MRALVASILVLILAGCSDAIASSRHRSASEKFAFRLEHPCPSTGAHRGACPGYVVDHHVALCVGGPDARENMRWMTAAAATAKDRWECRAGWQERLQACEAAGQC